MTEVDTALITTDVLPPPSSANEVSPLPASLTPEMKQRLWRMGEALPHSHALSQVVKNVVNNLGIPPEISVICLDSDEPAAFYSNADKCIVFSMGMGKKLMEQGLTLTEDHLAAIFAHEITHEDTNERANGDYSFIRTSKLHGEEYRADREGMFRMAEAGYNPHAMIEVFQPLGLTLGRYDDSHPEIIERIRHLEQSLADDIHPIPNTTKKFQTLPNEVISFIKEPSHVYDETEALLSLSSHELQNCLLHTTTQAEFWKYYRQERHAQRVEYARTLAARPELSQIVRKAILYKVISRSLSYFVDGELQPTLEPKTQQAIKNTTDQTERHTPNSNYYAAFGTETSYDNTFLDSLPYRLGLSPGSIDSTTNAAFHARCVEADTALNSMITQQLNALANDSLPPSYRRFLALVEQQAQDPTAPLSSDVLSTAFNLLNSSVAEARLTRNNKFRDQHGLRLEDQTNESFVDFSDSSQSQRVLDAAALSTAIELLETIPENPAAQAHLETILANETQLNPEEAHLLREYLFHTNESAWFDYLATIPRDQLIPFNQKIHQISLSESPSRPSARPKCSGYFASNAHLTNSFQHLPFNQASKEMMWKDQDFRAHPFRYPHDLQKDAQSPLDFSLYTHCAWEIYRRGLPPSAPTYFDPRWPGFGLHLDTQELSLMRESLQLSFDHDYGHIEDQINAAALSRTLDKLKTGEPPDQNDFSTVLNLQSLDDLNNYDSTFRLPLKLTLQDVFLLNEFIPWPPTRKASMLGDWLFTNRGPISMSATPEMKNQIISLIQNLHSACRQEQTTAVNLSEVQKRISDAVHEVVQIRLTESMLFFKLNDIQYYKGGGPSLDETQQETILATLKELNEQHYILAPHILLVYPTAASRFLFEATQTRVEALAQMVSDQPTLPPSQLSLSEMLWLLSIDPNRDKHDPSNYIFHKDDYIPVTLPMIQALQDRFGYAIGTEWVLSHFGEHDIRDRLLLGLAEQMTAPQLDQMRIIITYNLSPHALEAAQKTDNQFLFAKYAAAKKQAKSLSPEIFQIAKGQRRHANDFPDLLLRRHDFATQSPTVDTAKVAEYTHRSNLPNETYFYCIKGTETQGFLARILAVNEPFYLDPTVPLGDRINSLVSVVPYAVAPRDTYVEWLLQETFQLTDVHERLITAKQLLPLFTEKSPYKQQYATHMLRDEILTQPDFYQSPQTATDIVIQYIPEASLARNYFLDLIEEKCQVTPNDLDYLESLRLTDEGEHKQSNSNTFTAEPSALVFDRLSEQNQLERTKSVLWIMGLSQDKPYAINEIETSEDGSLEGLKTLFAQATPPEREIFFKRMFLGAEGILDLAAVNNTHQQEAFQQRHLFLETLSKTFIPLENDTNNIFRSIFVTTLEAADPSHASQILTALFNEAIETKLSGQQLSPEAFLALSLNQLGVVGKKVAQSLAGMDWVPIAYRNELQRSQEAAGVVPKRALKVFAQSAGLLAPGAPLQIISFNQLLGSASNKQACLITAVVNDETIAQSLGISPSDSINLVGKYKRPSVHKSTNLEHDLKLLDTVLDVLKQSNQSVNLPPGFSTQIRNAIVQELDFSMEKAFSDKLGQDIRLRNVYEGYTVSIPTIAWLNQDQVYETEAKGYSLRKLVDTAKDHPATTPEINRIKRVVFHEALSELLTTGRVHADVHFGNCFADMASHNVELIDLGMNTEIKPIEIIAVREMLIGLVLGNKSVIDKALQNFGWQLPATRFTRGHFSENTKRLLECSKQAHTPPPETVSMLLFSISKLPPLIEGLKTADILTVVKDVIPEKQLKLHAEILLLDKVASILKHISSR